MGHTLGLHDSKDEIGSLMTVSDGPLSPKEVDTIWEEALDKLEE